MTKPDIYAEMAKTVTVKLDKQNAEFDALTKLAAQWETLSRVPVVDDDYPAVRHRYEGALKDFINAMRANGRIPPDVPLFHAGGTVDPAKPAPALFGERPGETVMPSPRGKNPALGLPYGDHNQPHPRWKPDDGSDRHPQTVAEWNYHNDPAGEAALCAERRLNVAIDYADPRAPDQMALVLRIDLMRVSGELTHKRAFFNMMRDKAKP